MNRETLGQKLRDPERVKDALAQSLTMNFKCNDEAHRRRLKTGFLVQFLFGVVICFVASLVFAVALALGLVFPPLLFLAFIGIGFTPMLYAYCANAAMDDAKKCSSEEKAIPSETQNRSEAGPICCRLLPQFGAKIDQEAERERNYST
jgi:hypothetical protein